MPELPDLTLYLEALERRVLGQSLNQMRIWLPHGSVSCSIRPAYEIAFRLFPGYDNVLAG
jgi:hypothetical protein